MSAIIGVDSLGRKTYTFGVTNTIETLELNERVLIEVRGAKGGNCIDRSRTGGAGATVKGILNLKGKILKILVGGLGGDQDSSAGGGGGSFVAFDDNTPILIAGGGGGADTSSNGQGSTVLTDVNEGLGNGGRKGSWTNSSNGAVFYSYSGGGGFHSDGEGKKAQSGKSFINGGAGGKSSHGAGGFGGGGAGDSGGVWFPGGGGGYNGGRADGGAGTSFIGDLVETVSDKYVAVNNFAAGIVIITVLNSQPDVVLTQPNSNKTLYENDLFTITGNVTDADTDNFVNVRFSIDNGVAKALVAGISDGVSAIPFNKVLTFKGGKLYDGGTAVTDSLAENVAHTLKVWATDDKGGTSTEKTVTFYVVPNRAPALTIAQPIIAGSINADKFTISGECADPDGNEIVVAYRINGSVAKEIYRGIGATWNFEVAFAELNVGTNAIVVDVTDSYGFKASKTLKLSKTEIKKPVNKSTARYEIVPPKGTASGVILYIQRTQSLKVSVEVSMTLKGEQEQYTAMDLTNTAPVSAGVLEDEFTFNAEEAKEKIVVKMKMEKMNDYDAITLVSGVLL